MIRIEHLTKEYADISPIRDLNAEIHQGEVISIIGPSGTGKSTLLRCLNLLETPTSGKIWVDGEEITAPGCDLSALRQKMGMVFQSFNLFSHMNVLENIMYAPIRLKGLDKAEAKALAIRQLRLVGLENKQNAYPDELSGGQKQRVAIARALAMEPEILLFDEPTSALDPTMVGEVLAVIRDLAGRGMTMLIVTHEMKFARLVSSRIFYMNEGRIYEEGTPEQIFDHPQKELTRQFIRQLRIWSSTLTASEADLPGLVSGLEAFCRRHLIPEKMCLSLQLLIEELCISDPAAGTGENNLIRPMKLEFEYAETDSSGVLTLSYPGDELNLRDRLDNTAGAIVDHAARELLHRYENGLNIMRITLAG